MQVSTIDRRQFSRQYPSSQALQDELAMAASIQRSQLKSAGFCIRQFEIAGHSISCLGIGGDYFDVLSSPDCRDDCLKIVVGDVSGHGIAAALLMSSVRAFFRVRGSRPANPAMLVSEMNKHFFLENCGTGHFMTVFHLRIDLGTGIITWVRAGHDPAVVLAPGLGCIVLKGVGLPLGVEYGATYEEYCLSQLPAGSVIAIGTDGIWNAQDAEGNLFGKERFNTLLRESSSQSAGQIVTTMFSELSSFCKNVPLDDDVTLVVVKIR